MRKKVKLNHDTFPARLAGEATKIVKNHSIFVFIMFNYLLMSYVLVTLCLSAPTAAPVAADAAAVSASSGKSLNQKVSLFEIIRTRR